MSGSGHHLAHGRKLFLLHELLLDAFNTDVRPLCARVRLALGAAEEPIAELRSSGYLERQTRVRASENHVVKG